MRILEKITDILTKLLTCLACAYLIYLLFACAAQVFSRYVLNASFSWTEETARYAFAGMGMMGAPVAIRKGMHVSVDILETKLKGSARFLQQLVIYLCILAVSAILLVKGYSLFAGMAGIYSPAVRLPMKVVYYTVPVCGAASIWMVLVGMAECVAAWRKELKG